MNIHSVYGLFLPYFRKRRFETFVEIVGPDREETILDIGGYPESWTTFDAVAKSVQILNLHKTEVDPATTAGYGIETVAGDGTALEFDDESFDIVFSNSVIEHVGDFEKQRQFASEARRVGGRLWVQTPAREFFFEPHFLTPFFHWLPLSVRHRLGRFTLWALISNPSPAQVRDTVDEIRLLDREEMQELFPDCQIRTERLAHVFTKSHIAVRT